MDTITIGRIEADFADLIWENEPVSSGDLVKLSADKLGWKKSTTYTVLRRLTEKGIFKSENAMVSHILTKDEFYALQSEQFVENSFKGSLPAFVAAFSSRKGLSEKDIQELREIINRISPQSGE